MNKTWRLNNFSNGMFYDVGNGKQPPNSLNFCYNLVPDKKLNSLTTRNGYTAGITKPTDIDVLDEYLSFPVTNPSSFDHHIYFGQDVSYNKHIWVYPYFHNSSSATSGWVDVGDTKDLVTAISATVLDGTARTITITGVSTFSLNTTANYYKNWIIALNDSSQTPEFFLVKSYSVSGSGALDTATFTVDTLKKFSTGSDWAIGDVVELYLVRYLHGQNPNAGYNQFKFPSYTSPAGYNSELAIRFSGGASTSQTHKPVWFGYLNKVFFPSDGTYKYTFTGSYADYAKCLKPSTGLLKSFAATDSESGMLILSAADYEFTSATHWGVSGINYSVAQGKIELHEDYEYLWETTSVLDCIYITAGGTGDASNCVTLSNSLSNSYIATPSATPHTLLFQYSYKGDDNPTVVFLKGSTEIGRLRIDKTVGVGGEDFVRTAYLTFTPSAVDESLSFYFLQGTYSPLAVTWINYFPTTNENFGIRGGRTYNLYATFMYDGYQESDPIRLSSTYVTSKRFQLKTILQQKLGALNKRIEAIRLYMSIEDYNSTLNSNTTHNALRYFFREISLIDSTSTWTFNTSTGYFEYTDYFTSVDEDAMKYTWEQRTGRVENSSNSPAFGLAENASGRIFLAQFNHGTQTVTNSIQFTGFNDDGNACEDIFPDDPIYFQSKLTTGRGINITSLLEFNGDLVVFKPNSTVLMNTSDLLEYWRPKLISDGMGCAYDKTALRWIDGIVWADSNNVYYWAGGIPENISLYRFKSYAGASATSEAWIDSNDQTYNISIGTAYFKIYPRTFSAYFQNLLPTDLDGVVTTKDGTVYFSKNDGTNYYFSTSKTDAGTAIVPYFDTGKIYGDGNTFILLDEFRANIYVTGTPSANPTFTVYVDETSVKSKSMTLASGNNFFRLLIPPHKAGRYFNVVMDLPATSQEIFIDSIEMDFNEQHEKGDKRTA